MLWAWGRLSCSLPQSCQWAPSAQPTLWPCTGDKALEEVQPVGLLRSCHQSPIRQGVGGTVEAAKPLLQRRWEPGVRGSLRSHSHCAPCLLITRLISDPSLQEDPKINPLPSLLPLSSSGVILKVAGPQVLWLSLLWKNRLWVPKQAQGSV